MVDSPACLGQYCAIIWLSKSPLSKNPKPYPQCICRWPPNTRAPLSNVKSQKLLSIPQLCFCQCSSVYATGILCPRHHFGSRVSQSGCSVTFHGMIPFGCSARLFLACSKTWTLFSSVIRRRNCCTSWLAVAADVENSRKRFSAIHIQLMCIQRARTYVKVAL